MTFSLRFLLPLLFGLSLFAAIHFGFTPLLGSDYSIFLQQFWHSLLHPTAESSFEFEGNSYIIWAIRLPQAIFAALIGATLALAGALTQALFRNPLADPAILGISSGAAASVAIGLVLLSPTLGLQNVDAISFIWFIPTLAFIGGLTTCFSITRITHWIGSYSTSGLLLTGIAVNALLGALIGLCNFLANDATLRGLSIWSLGTTSGASWQQCILILIALLFGVFLTRPHAQSYNALALGEHVAQHIGIKMVVLRRSTLIQVALLSALAVGFAGLIGFIGLVAPHIARLLYGHDHRHSIFAAMWIGAILLLWADIASRMVAPPILLPIGIFTALIGVPFFIALLRQMHTRRSLG